jgi:hypothetical protein
MEQNDKLFLLFHSTVSFWALFFTMMSLIWTWALFVQYETRRRKGPGFNLKEF